MMRVIRTLHNILNHPLTTSAKWAAFKRYIRWQIGGRLTLGPTLVPFVNDTRLLVALGDAGATGDIYTGLYEYCDCAFLLHLLRPSDLFVDIGANVGVYTVLASGVIGAHTISIEPIPLTYAKLTSNIHINNITDRVTSYNIGLGRANDTLRFTADLDCYNHVVIDSTVCGRMIEVPVRTLVEVLERRLPTLIKIDVEGWEAEVLAGAEAALGHQSLLGLIVEMNSGEKDLSPNERVVHNCLTNHGFRPYTYEPFMRRLSSLTTKNINGGNTIYLRNIKSIEERLMTAAPFRVNGREI